MHHPPEKSASIAHDLGRISHLGVLLVLSACAWGCADEEGASTGPDTSTVPTSDAGNVDVPARSDDGTPSQDTVPAEDNGTSPDTEPGTQDTASTPGIDYAGESNLESCGANPSDATRYAIIGFWKSSDCAGEPMKTNAFPINDTAGCYCWPGNSGANSADSFACDPEAKTVTIIQYNSLTCGAGDNTPTSKTFHLDKCEQDIPPTLYSKVVDMGPCTN